MSETSKFDFYLYIFVIVGYDTMGRGRCAAQVSHAANDFTDKYIITPLLTDLEPDEQVMNWRSQANGFGTVIVKAVPNLYKLKKIIEESEMFGFKASIVVDPEYFVPDGDIGHLISNLVTCGYVFGDKNQLQEKFFEIPLLLNDPVDKLEQFK